MYGNGSTYSNNNVLKSYNTKITTVVMEEGITIIGNDFFFGRREEKTVYGGGYQAKYLRLP